MKKFGRKAAEVVGSERFFVAHCSAPVDWCREHDEQGVYAKADAGELANFPGVSAEYEAPTAPDIILPVHELSIEECADRVIDLLEQQGMLG